MSYKIAIDSCGELLNEWKDDERIESVPLTLMVGGESIIDDETFDQKDFLKKVAACLECPKSACPSPERYMKAYECEADHIYAVTLSSELSGSYNSAVLGKSLFLEDNPGKKIHVFNSKSASGGESLIAMKIVECEEKGLSLRLTLKNSVVMRSKRNNENLLKDRKINEKWNELNVMEQKIMQMLFDKGESKTSEIAEFIDRDRKTARRLLKKLCDNNLIEWIGTSNKDPRKIYRIKK